MSLLKKEAALFARDEEGKLVPQELPLEIDEEDELQKEFKELTIKVIPLVRGELKKMFARLPKLSKDEKEDPNEEYDMDGEIVSKYCKEPSYTIKEVKDMKPALITAIVNTIFLHSGLDIRKDTKRKAMEKKEDEFAKN